MKRILILLLMAVTMPAAVRAGQTPAPAAAAAVPPPGCQTLMAVFRAARTPTEKELAAAALSKMNLEPPCFAELLLSGAKERQSYGRFLKALESRRTDKQAGAAAGTGGSTSPVVKGTTAKVLSLAAEYGALTQSVNKQIVTVQGSLDGVPAALVRHRVLPYCPTSAASPDCLNREVFEWLRRVSYGVSFDTSQNADGVTATAAGTAQGRAQPVTFDASGHSMTAATARFVLWNARDATSATFQKAWIAAVTKTTETPRPLVEKAVELRKAMAGMLGTIEKDPDYIAWQAETRTLLQGTSDADFDRVWADRARVLTAIAEKSNQEVASLAATFAETLSAYQFEEDEVVRAVAEKPVLTLQYDYTRPTAQPPTSTLRLVFDKGFGEHWSVAANAGVELYDQRPSADIPDANRVRDAQFGLQVQYDLGKLTVLGAAAVSGTYYFQYQNSPSILDVTPPAPLTGITFVSLAPGATQVFADKGHLHVAQFRLVLGPRESSARFPVAISYANRTELIDKPVWRAQIGVSYDFDALFAR